MADMVGCCVAYRCGTDEQPLVVLVEVLVLFALCGLVESVGAPADKVSGSGSGCGSCSCREEQLRTGACTGCVEVRACALRSALPVSSR